MDKWIFVNNVTGLEKLYILTKTVKEKTVTPENNNELFMNALNENGSNRTDANSHPLMYILFYNMICLKEKRHVMQKLKKLLLNKKRKTKIM